MAWSKDGLYLRLLRVDLKPSVTFPDFITSARRELIEFASFFAFLGGLFGW